VIGALRAVLEERRAAGSGPAVFANFVMMRENIEELPRWVAAMAELGVDGCHAEHVVVPDFLGAQSLVRHKRLAAEMIAEARATAARCGIPLRLPAPFPEQPGEEPQPGPSREQARAPAPVPEARPPAAEAPAPRPI